MAISALVVTLASDSRRREEALQRLSGFPQLELGELAGPRLPVVMDTPDTRSARACWREIVGLPGVEDVSLVWVHYEDESLPHSRDELEEEEDK